MREHYDFLIVGGGLYGLTCARTLTNRGFSCLLIEKRPYLGGLCHTIKKNGIDIHENGIHVFHTSDEAVWNFVNRYIKFDSCQLKVCATDEKDMYSLPFNMYTFSKILGLNTPEEVFNYISKQKVTSPKNFEEQAVNFVGKEVYEKLIKSYTEKQWGKKCIELPTAIIKRLPVRYSFDNNYFDDIYQGVCDYTKLSEHIVNGINAEGKFFEGKIDYILNIDFISNKKRWISIADKVIYCGSVDELLDYELGELSWRSLRWEHETYVYNGHNGQGCALLNNVNDNVSYTRTIDHVQINPKNKDYRGESIITYEYPISWDRTKERFYPNGDIDLYNRYTILLEEKYPSIILGGRVGLYKYMDMDEVISVALDFCDTIKKEEKRDEFCNIWVVGTYNKDVLLHENDIYRKKFITTVKQELQNINELNRFLCEYVAMWYVWKNDIYSEYVGFCHYRRKINITDICFQELAKGAIQFFHELTITAVQDKVTLGFSEFKRGLWPDFLLTDFEKYLSIQKIISQERLKSYLHHKKGSIIRSYCREIYTCKWEVFCELMTFVNGYIEFIANKYNLITFNDWKRHISSKVILFFKNRGKEYPNNYKDRTLELLYQTKEDYLRIFDEEEGFNTCNAWRVYAYLIEDMISIYIGTHRRVHQGILTT